MFRHFFCVGCESGPFTGRQVVHPDPVTFKTDFFKQHFRMVHSFASPYISVIIVACPLQAAYGIDAVRTLLDRKGHVLIDQMGRTDLAALTSKVEELLAGP